jgi:hypothetical protein
MPCWGCLLLCCSRKVGDVETLLVKYEQVFNPRLFVVKAYQLKRLIMRCQLFTVARHAAGQEAGEEGEGGQLQEGEGLYGVKAAGVEV